MPRENSFTDSEGRSLTPDMEEQGDGRESLEGMAVSPAYNSPTQRTPHVRMNASSEPPRSGRPNPVTSPTSRQSIRSRMTHHTNATNQRPSPWSGMTPIEKFRAAARRVIALHRSTTLLSGGGGRIGAEPGVNPRRASAEALYGHIREDCEIEVIDYSSVRSSFGHMTNREFINLMGDPAASQRDPWVKVRWINIGGISWDVIKALSIKYGEFVILSFSILPNSTFNQDLHPLALEDIFHTRSQNRSKADYYPKHLFLRVLCHQLGEPDEIDGSSSSQSPTLTGELRSASPLPMEEPEDDSEDFNEKDDVTLHGSGPNSRQSTTRKKKRMLFLNRNEKDLEAMMGPESSGSSLTKLMKAEGAVSYYKHTTV